jgi:hypothetical protein
MTDVRLGHVIWDALHAVAVNFPDGAAGGLTQERLKGYYDFYNSLKYVLPRDEWREKWTIATSSGNATRLDHDAFISKMRDHKALSKWLFDVHKKISDILKKRSKKGDGYATWYAKYAQFRRHGKDLEHVPLNKDGIEAIIGIIQRENKSRAIDEYMVHRVGPSYRSWRVARKHQARKNFMIEAGKYFWRKFYAEEAKQKNFEEMDMNRKRAVVISAFREGTRSLIRRAVNRVRDAPRRVTNYIGLG